MDEEIDVSGNDIERDAAEQICRILGYDPTDVRSVYMRGADQCVVVEVFARLPTPGFERGVRFQAKPGGFYVRARITHRIGNRKPATQEEN